MLIKEGKADLEFINKLFDELLKSETGYRIKTIEDRINGEITSLNIIVVKEEQ